MNDIFLAVWKNVDRYTGEKASFRTWLTAVARYQVLSHIRDIRYHDYVSLDDVEPVGDSDVKSRLFDEEEMLEFQKLLELLSEEDRQNGMQKQKNLLVRIMNLYQNRIRWSC